MSTLIGGAGSKRWKRPAPKPAGACTLSSLWAHSGAARQAQDEAAAEVALARGLERLGLTAEELQALPRGAAEKAVLAWGLRQRTTVTLRWVSQRLDMGH